MKHIIFATFLLTNSFFVFANDYEFGNFTISKLRLGSGGAFVALSPAPVGCGGGDQYRMHLKVNDNDTDDYKDMVSGLLSAHATGQKIEVLWYSNKGVCSATHVLILDMFEFAAK